MMRLWPRTIRLQLLGGLVLLEALSLLLFGTLLVHQQADLIHARTMQRLKHQADSLSLQAQGDLGDGQLAGVSNSVRMMGEAPSVSSVKITDVQGRILFAQDDRGRKQPLQPQELEQMRQAMDGAAHVFGLASGQLESVKAVWVNGSLYGFAWIETDKAWDDVQLDSTLNSIALFGAVWMFASVLLAWLLARSITNPLALLHKGTRSLMSSAEGPSQFPLPITAQNEIGDLIEAFNRMVASIDEQRTGLSDALSLLDSMLENAPIGLAFFDRHRRCVRVNKFFSEATGVPLTKHLGRTLPEVLPAAVAQQLEKTIELVLEQGLPVRDIELTGANESTHRPWTWIASAYPIHAEKEEMRRVGLIVLDASDRKRSEEALRKTEKLAATGRLAASIAHEINNPLEAITNLLYLLTSHSDLGEPARGYAVLAEHEVKRIAEITQQTLRFYRQSTLPARANLAELLDSVLTLHQVRLRNRGIVIEARYDNKIDLYCFAGELRQVFANLVGNAIDAMPSGGRLVVRARHSHNWKDPAQSGVRFVVADTGLGMPASVKKHIFEPFFTTKDITGTGLGLWVSSEIIVKHNGMIHVRSNPGASGESTGTVFELFFPDMQDLAAAPSHEHMTAKVGR